MPTILITGAKGFIGKNISLFFKQANYEVINIDVDHTKEELLSSLSKADFIIHLAGVNRSTSNEDFELGNVDFTVHLTQLLESLHKSTPMIVSSSTQALLEKVKSKATRIPVKNCACAPFPWSAAFDKL